MLRQCFWHSYERIKQKEEFQKNILEEHSLHDNLSSQKDYLLQEESKD